MTLQQDAARAGRRSNTSWIAAWLIGLCALIAILISVGGYTRLTGSGLSIVEWAPVSGIVPPLNEQQWRSEFENYQQFPEFRIINPDMDLDGFKRIFWIEYLHRAIARGIAFAFLIPYVVFLLRRQLARPLAVRLALVFVLGGAQGALGWYMVQSGLADDPSVSQYRLTAHLSLAVAIYGYLLWLAAGLLAHSRLPRTGAAAPVAAAPMTAVLACMALAALMQVSGGFMAGTHAGFAYNTYPDMNGVLIPAGILALEPAWRNLFDNVIAIQFAHRWTAVALVAAIAWLWLTRFKVRQRWLRGLHDAAGAIALAQFALGVTTLLSRVWMPVALAHQMGFVVLFSILVVMLRVHLEIRNRSAVAAS